VRVDRDRANIAEKQSVAIRRRPRGHFHADIAGGTRPVVNHDLLTERLREASLQQPDREVGCSGRRERHDDVDGPGGVAGGVIGGHRFGHVE